MLDGDVSDHGRLQNIDQLYRFILSSRQCLHWEKATEVLHNIVCLADPLSAYDLNVLFEANWQPYLIPLAAVLSVPSTTSKAAVQTYHASLHDFLASPESAGELYVEPHVVHRRLFVACSQMMARKLKRDICDLRDHSRAQDDVPGFRQKRDAVITPALRYACLYWVHHLQRTRPDGGVQGLLTDFLQTRLLYWIEVFALAGELQLAVQCLVAASTVILVSPTISHRELTITNALFNRTQDWKFYMQREISVMLLRDAQRLIREFSPAIAFSVLHVYATALPLSPAKSQLRQVYSDALADAAPIRVEEGLDDGWDCVTLRIDNGAPVNAIALSADGARVAATSRRGVDVYDSGTGTLVASRDWDGEMWCVRYSYQNHLLAVLDTQGEWHIWDLLMPNSFSRLEGRPDEEDNILDSLASDKTSDNAPVAPDDASAFSRDGTSVACAYAAEGNSSSTAVYIWATEQPLYPTLRIAQAGTGRVQALQFAHAGDRIMSATRGGVYLFDARSGELLWHDSVPQGVRWSGALWHAFAPSDDFTVHVDPEEMRLFYGRLKGPFSGRKLGVHSLGGERQQKEKQESLLSRKKLLGWVKRGNDLKPAASDGTPFDVRPIFVGSALAAVRAGSTVYTRYRQRSAVDPSWRVAAQLAASGGTAIEILDLSLAGSAPAEDNSTLVSMLPTQALSPFVALFKADYARNAGEIHLHTSSRSPTVLAVPVTNTTGLGVSPDMSVYSFIQDNRIHLHSVATGRRLCRIAPAPERKDLRSLDDYHHVFSPRSTYLATAVDSQLKLWRTTSGALIDAVTVPALQSDTITFSSDENRVAWIRATHSGPDVDVFEVAGSPQRLRRLASFNYGRWEPSRPVVAACRLAFSSGVSGSDDSSIRCLLHDGASVAVYEWCDGMPGPVRIAYGDLPEPELEHRGQVVVRASPNLERVCYTTTAASRRSYVLNLDTASVIPEELGDEGDRCAAVKRYEADPEHDPAVLPDVRSWSDIGISADGWLCKGSRKLCWLPLRYRPKLSPPSDGGATSESVEFQVVGNRVVVLAESRPLVLRSVEDVRYFQEIMASADDSTGGVYQAPLRRETTRFSILSGRSMSHRRFRSAHD
ncbi:YVTN repeat-like/Quino protein amine dehydrogenase [Coniophora puteana RWD-64-598 SS2]|uniref:YVTN repeat-like/Quino protein amine dehydrogenase n=1 Tax=Coniophora puteana (strain RWD-64-598) TaxID=741705 RepID=A0A5M3ME67_CONPW|nr:YVTN repeat-like/Quino protein amine dehydrogenase [Coniophora puteana RWD-64-598 SS2]EIW77094.1 YVTN repeat-like/Quino protein amine dehydrogenase [Coniophora puteana RWD-64-598 SS2]